MNPKTYFRTGALVALTSLGTCYADYKGTLAKDTPGVQAYQNAWKQALAQRDTVSDAANRITYLASELTRAKGSSAIMGKMNELEEELRRYPMQMKKFNAANQHIREVVDDPAYADDLGKYFDRNLLMLGGSLMGLAISAGLVTAGAREKKYGNNSQR